MNKETEQSFRCPICGEQLYHIIIVSECWQKAYIDKDGKIIDYGSVEEITKTLSIECPKCSREITEHIKEI